VPSSSKLKRPRSEDRSEDACRIYVVRHGTTRMNVENRYRGRREVPLDEQGWQDARRAAEMLGFAGLTAIYSGPLLRTLDTARVISEGTGGAPVYPVPGLINLDYGEWEGLTSQESRDLHPPAYRRYIETPELAVCPGGEALADAAARMVAALESIGQRHPGQSVVAVSHAVMVRLAVARVTGRFGPQWRFPLPTGSATVFDYRGSLSLPLRDNEPNWVVRIPEAGDVPSVGSGRSR
jgi:broad specificity phosphatase PhoE